MEIVIIVLKLVVGLSILNVWLINPKKSSKWRGGEAKTIIEEFAVYKLPAWSVYVVGFFKVALSLMLLLSIKYEGLNDYAAIGLAFFLSGSVLMHIKVKDPFFKSIPALSFLLLSLVIAVLA